MPHIQTDGVKLLTRRSDQFARPRPHVNSRWTVSCERRWELADTPAGSVALVFARPEHSLMDEDEKRELRIKALKLKLGRADSPLERAEAWRKLREEIDARSPEMKAKLGFLPRERGKR